MMWWALAGAIAAEVSGTLALRMASVGRKAWVPLMVACYVGSFSLLSVALSQGMTIGVAYGIWTAVGVALTAIAGRVLFKEPLTWVMGLGIVLIGAGVLLLETGLTQHS